MCISNVNMQSIDFKCFCIKPQMKDMFVFHEESYYTFSKIMQCLILLSCVMLVTHNSYCADVEMNE